MNDWDRYHLSIAEAVRQKSKDPSAKIGAVLTDKNAIISTGYNGFPIGIIDFPSRWERPLKYQYVCHAERNAIALAARKGTATLGSTLYLVGMGPPTVPCVECTKMIIQAGIVRVVGQPFMPTPEHWKNDFTFALELLEEAGIEFVDVRTDWVDS